MAEERALVEGRESEQQGDGLRATEKGETRTGEKIGLIPKTAGYLKAQGSRRKKTKRRRNNLT